MSSPQVTSRFFGSKDTSRKARKTTSGRYAPEAQFASQVKKVLWKNSETKIYRIAVENQQLYHNTGTTGYTYVGPCLFNPWRYIPLGTNNHSRVGDTITPVGMSVRLWMANKLDRPNILYRVLVLIMPKSYNSIATGAGNLDIGAPFQNGTNGNYMTMPIDTEKGIKVLYDKVFSNELGYSANPYVTGGKECHLFKKLWIKRKRSRNIVFDTAGVEIVNNPLNIYVIPYDSFGTLTTDNIASCAWTTTLYYKDI